MAEHPDLVQPLFLIMHGVSEEMAFSLSPRKRLAWCIAIGTHKGGRWDWSANRWSDAA